MIAESMKASPAKPFEKPKVKRGAVKTGAKVCARVADD